MAAKRLPVVITLALVLLSPVCRSQVLRFQSFGAAGTTGGQAGTTTKASMTFGGVVSQGAGQSNQAGMMWGSLDFRPASQATAISFSALASNQLTLTWTNGNGARRIVVAKASSAVNASPASGTAYAANTAFGSGTQISAGNYVVFDGTGNSVTVTNLSPSVVYYFKVFEYNGKYGANNANIEYQPGDVSGNPSNRTTLATQPTVIASGFSTTGLAKDQMTIQWANGDGANRIVVMKSGSAVDALPVDGNTYTANAAFASGSQIGTGNFVVYAGGGNQVTVTGLLPSTNYYYQVFELNGTGADDNYLTTAAGSSQLTLTTAPVATAGTALAQTSFDANWQATGGATEYFLDVSTDPTFGSFVTGYQNKSVGAGLTSSVTGLTSGTVYNVRVRAGNAAGSSANSNVIQATTVPATPTVVASTNITTTGFTANWSASSLTTTYSVDISTSSAFSTFVSGFNGATIGGTSIPVTGLQPGTDYFIRVKAQNGSGTSPYSTTFEQFTKTAAPAILDATNVNSTAFKAKWSPVTGATGYDLEVSSDNFVSQVAGYPKVVSITEDIVTGLQPETIYKYRVRGVNSAGESDYSAESLVITQTSTGQASLLPHVTNPQLASGVASATVTGGVPPITYQMKHRQITSTKFTTETPTSSGGTASINVNDQWLDELGIEYYFIMTDAAHRTDSTGSAYSYRSFSAFPIPTLESGANNYKMFSIPAAISGQRIDDLLQPVIAAYGGYEKTKWRLFHYQNNQYVEYKAGLETMDPGNSYWIITDDASQNITVSSPVVNANQNTPFHMTFAKGWNQIASPYPFNVDWAIVKSTPSNATVGLNSVWKFTGTYQKSGVLTPWSGAFVFADNGGDVTFPVTSRTTNGGRIAAINSNPDEEEWQLPVELSLGELNEISAVGMHPSAKLSKDEFDEITLPRFNDYVELSTYHNEFFSPYFMIDVVPTSSTYEWKFKAESNSSASEATIVWDQDALAKAESSLMLIDVDASLWIDMKTTKSYTFPWKTGKELTIAYNRNGEPQTSMTLAGTAYPNPFKDRVTIPILNASDNQIVTVHVYDLLGRKVRSLSQVLQRKGEFKINWDGRNDNGDEVASGMLFYRLQYGSSLSKAQRIIKE